MTDPTIPLVNQPTAAPTRKIAGVGLAAVAGTVLTGVIATSLPDLSTACGEELGGVLAPTLGAAVTGALAFLTGYLRHERADSAP